MRSLSTLARQTLGQFQPATLEPHDTDGLLVACLQGSPTNRIMRPMAGWAARLGLDVLNTMKTC